MLEGVVNPNGAATDAWFEYGTDPALSDFSLTAAKPVGSGLGNQMVNDSLTGLPENVMHYCRIVAENRSGVTKGAITPFYVTNSEVTQKSVAYQVDVAHSGKADFGLPLAFQVSPSWSVSLPDTVSYPVIANGIAYVLVRGPSSGIYGTRLYALDLESGDTVWGPLEISGTYYWSGHTYENGILYVVNFDGLLKAINAATGSLVWSTRLAGQYAFSSPPTVSNGIVYVGGAGSGGTLYAVNALTGVTLWSRSVINGDHSSPVLGNGGVYVSYPCHVYKFDQSSGAPVWHYNSGCSGGGGRTAAYYDGMLYVRDSSSGAVYNTINGTRGLTFASSTIPAFSNTKGILLSNGTLRCFNPLTLDVAWSFAGEGNLVTAPLVIDGMVVVGSSTGLVYALDIASGAQVWSGRAGNSILGPDEHNVTSPLVGMAAGEGYLLVPAGSKLTAWHIAGH